MTTKPDSSTPKCGLVHKTAFMCNQPNGHSGPCSYSPPLTPEPTLTCSEVVERLIAAGVVPVSGWHRKQAEEILHSWREREDRNNLAMLLDRMGGDSVVAYQEGRTADEFRDYIYEHFVWWGERNREEERLNNDKK